MIVIFLMWFSKKKYFVTTKFTISYLWNQWNWLVIKGVELDFVLMNKNKWGSRSIHYVLRWHVKIFLEYQLSKRCVIILHSPLIQYITDLIDVRCDRQLMAYSITLATLNKSGISFIGFYHFISVSLFE